MEAISYIYVPVAMVETKAEPSYGPTEDAEDGNEEPFQRKMCYLLAGPR